MHWIKHTEFSLSLAQLSPHLFPNLLKFQQMSQGHTLQASHPAYILTLHVFKLCTMYMISHCIVSYSALGHTASAKLCTGSHSGMVSLFKWSHSIQGITLNMVSVWTSLTLNRVKLCTRSWSEKGQALNVFLFFSVRFSKKFNIFERAWRWYPPKKFKFSWFLNQVNIYLGKVTNFQGILINKVWSNSRFPLEGVESTLSCG